MRNISELIRQTSEESTARTAERQAARANLSAMRVAVLDEITANPEQYQRFLDLLGDNIRCSPGNIALTLAQFTNPTQVGSLDYWHSLGRQVTPEEINKGAAVFVPPKNPSHRGYFMGSYYDVSQTTGRPLKEPTTLEDGSPRMETALKALMKSASVPLREEENLGCPAYYDPEKLEIAIDPSYNDGEIFAALATELALSFAHNKGYNREFSREVYQLDAESVGYLVCRRFGVECPKPKADNLALNYDGYETEDKEKALNHLCQTARNMGDRIDKAIQPRQQEQSRKNRYAR